MDAPEVAKMWSRRGVTPLGSFERARYGFAKRAAVRGKVSRRESARLAAGGRAEELSTLHALLLCRIIAGLQAPAPGTWVGNRLELNPLSIEYNGERTGHPTRDRKTDK